MVEQKYLDFLTQQLHTDAVRHSGRSFLVHLQGTHDLLQRWNNRHSICVAGLFHSIYGTWHFRHQSFPLDRRDVIRDLIGEEAEFLAYVFCVTKRPEAFLGNVAAPAVTLCDWATNEAIAISRDDLNSLLEIEAANLLEQNAKNGEVLRRLRQSSISAAAKHDIDVHLQKLSRANTAAGLRQKPSGPQTGAARAPMTDTQIKQVRQTVLFDMCRFMLKDNASAPSFASGLAQKFLARPPFRRWLEHTGCLDIYNRLYIKDPHISALYAKLDAFLLSTTREVVGHIFKAAGIRPIIIKGSEILREYAPHPIGSSAGLDLVVLQPHFGRACDALRDQDWVQGRYQKDRGFVPCAPDVMRRAEESQYETLPFSKAFELALSGAERDRIAAFRDGTFFKVVEIGQQSIKFIFEIDMHWDYLSNLRADMFQLKDSVVPFAATLDDSDQLYLMLLRNYDEAIKDAGKLENLIVSLLLMERGRVDWQRIRHRATADGRETAIAANIALLEKISPDLARIADPKGQMAQYRPDDAGMELFLNSLIGLKGSF